MSVSAASLSSQTTPVNDNYYEIRFGSGTPDFKCGSFTDSLAVRLVELTPTPYVPGIHYLVDHTHLINPESNDEAQLRSHLNRINWDILIFQRILSSISLQYRKAVDILAKELAEDLTRKATIERKLQIVEEWNFYHPVLIAPVAAVPSNPQHEIEPLFDSFLNFD